MRRLLYPEPLIGTLPTFSLTSAMEPIYQFGTALAMAHRVPLLFKSSMKLTVRVSSVIGEEKNWLKAGYLAQVLDGLPGEPKKEVQQLYLDEGFFELEDAGYPFYLEFWPYRWLTDYFLELWAQQL